MQSTMQEVSRRNFLAQASYLGAMYAAASMIPLRALAGKLAQDPRISAAPVVDKGFASVRKIGNGLYATISDASKGLQTMCNGGFLVGTDGAMAIEGFVSAAGAAFQLETLHSCMGRMEFRSRRIRRLEREFTIATGRGNGWTKRRLRLQSKSNWRERNLSWQKSICKAMLRRLEIYTTW